mgnify:CR=1 FL=1
MGKTMKNNENNAKTWLSGYNTMSKAAQEKFDLKGYLIFFKSFFYNLGVYGTLLYFVLFFLTDDQFAIQVWIAAQLLPIPYLIYRGNKYKNKKDIIHLLYLNNQFKDLKFWLQKRH